MKIAYAKRNSIKPTIQRWIRRFRAHSIQSIIMWSFSAFILLIVIVVAVLLFNKFSRSAEHSVFLNAQQIVDQVSYNLEDYVDGMAQLYRAIEENMLADGQWDDEQVTQQLNTIMRSRDDIVSIALFNEQGNMLRNHPAMPVKASARVTEQSWFHSAMRVSNHLSFSLPHVQNLYDHTFKWVVTMSKGITVVHNGEPTYVILLVDINFKKIDELSSRISLGKRGYAYIIDEGAGNIVYHPQQQLIYMGLRNESVERALTSSDSYIDESDGVKRLNTVKSVVNIGWKIVGVSYLDEIMTTREEVNRYLVQVVAMVLVLAIAVSLILSAMLTRPIRRMGRTMKAVERGDFNVELPMQGPLEVVQLSSRFNLMLDKIRQLMKQIVKEQESKRRYELEAPCRLRSTRILYNTLNSVVRMVGMSKKEEVITMITSLSKLFRLSLSKGKTSISVREELEHARHYLTIQQMRYKQKFDFLIEADEAAQSCYTLKLVLQPLIENAIVHGIEYMVDQGHIHITAAIQGDLLEMTVRDNGVGMSPEMLERILEVETLRQHPAPFINTAGSGVAVRNVHDRIQLYYGHRYGLEYESELEEGTTVRIRIPIIHEPGEEREHD